MRVRRVVISDWIWSSDDRMVGLFWGGLVPGLEPDISREYTSDKVTGLFWDLTIVGLVQC